MVLLIIVMDHSRLIISNYIQSAMISELIPIVKVIGRYIHSKAHSTAPVVLVLMLPCSMVSEVSAC